MATAPLITAPPTTADTPISSAVVAEVHLAGMIAPQDRRTLRQSLFRAFNIDLIPEWAAAAACIVLIALGLARAIGLIDPGLLLFLGAALAIAAAILWIRHAVTLTYSDSYPLESDPAYRIRVTGWGSILPAAAGVIERARSTGGRDMSEPETFRISHASESTLELILRAASCFTVAILSLLLIKALFAPRIPFAAPWLPMLLALMITRTVWGFLWPTYVHIAPGRIEITRAPLLPLGPPSTTTYDLRTARILIDLRYGRVLLEPPAPDPQAAANPNTVLWLSGVMGHSTRAGQEMGLAILAAALSRFETPPTAATGTTPHL